MCTTDSPDSWTVPVDALTDPVCWGDLFVDIGPLTIVGDPLTVAVRLRQLAALVAVEIDGDPEPHLDVLGRDDEERAARCGR